MNIPNLAGCATADLVETIGGSGTFRASYINWARTLNLLREHAPGWLPEVVQAGDGSLLHPAPVGCYMLIRFRNGDSVTPAVPQAVMDTYNKAIPSDKVTARDVTDTHRRGVCLAAAFTFGLAYELWAKMPLESGHHDGEAPPEKEQPIVGHIHAPAKIIWDDIQPERQDFLRKVAKQVTGAMPDAAKALDIIDMADLEGEEERGGLWYLLDSKARSALRRASEQRQQPQPPVAPFSERWGTAEQQLAAEQHGAAA
jgi:hypothetical protein